VDALIVIVFVEPTKETDNGTENEESNHHDTECPQAKETPATTGEDSEAKRLDREEYLIELWRCLSHETAR
jgi:hypothetical protein